MQLIDGRPSLNEAMEEKKAWKPSGKEGYKKSRNNNHPASDEAIGGIIENIQKRE